MNLSHFKESNKDILAYKQCQLLNFYHDSTIKLTLLYQVCPTDKIQKMKNSGMIKVIMYTRHSRI